MNVVGEVEHKALPLVTKVWERETSLGILWEERNKDRKSEATNTL